jgi:hypothetical protein
MAARRHRITPANNPIDLRERAFETQWLRSQLKLFLLASSDDQMRFSGGGSSKRSRAVVERVREIVTRVLRQVRP